MFIREDISIKAAPLSPGARAFSSVSWGTRRKIFLSESQGRRIKFFICAFAMTIKIFCCPVLGRESLRACPFQRPTCIIGVLREKVNRFEGRKGFRLFAGVVLCFCEVAGNRLCMRHKTVACRRGLTVGKRRSPCPDFVFPEKQILRRAFACFFPFWAV